MEQPRAPRLPTVPLPAIEPRSRPDGNSTLRGIVNTIARRLRSSPATPAPAAVSVHPVLAHGLRYDAAGNPGTFTRPDGRPLAAAILEEPATLTYPHSAAALTFVRPGEGILTGSFIRCRGGRAVVAVRDVLEAVDAVLQGYGLVFQGSGSIWVHVRSPSVGDFCVSLSV